MRASGGRTGHESVDLKIGKKLLRSNILRRNAMLSFPCLGVSKLKMEMDNV